MNNKKRKASGRVPLDALLSAKDSMVLLDPKGELFAVMADKTKKNGGGTVTVNPFIVLPSLEKSDLCSKWFRLCIGAAMKDLKKVQRKEGNERQQRKSQRTD